MFLPVQFLQFSSSMLNSINVTDKLKSEHQQILRLINSVQYLSANELLMKGPQIVDFIRNFADKYHHAKEENILFKYFVDPKSLCGQTHCNPVPVMLNEHEDGRECVEMMEHAMEEKHSDNMQMYCEGYAELLAQHIQKEDNILYPMAEEALKEEVKEKIAEEYAEVEKKYDAKFFEKYENFLKEVEKMTAPKRPKKQ